MSIIYYDYQNNFDMYMHFKNKPNMKGYENPFTDSLIFTRQQTNGRSDRHGEAHVCHFAMSRRERA
jgi:hypothetical protein